MDIQAIQQFKKQFSLLPFDVEKVETQIKDLNEEVNKPEVYNNIDLYVVKNRLLTDLQYKLKVYSSIKSSIELLEEALDTEDIDFLETLLSDAQIQYNELKQLMLLTGKYDANDAVVTIHAGAGGTEACDWTDIVYRMYLMYCQKQGFTTTEIDRLAGDGAGIKSITFKVSGPNAYGYFKAEKGIHRLVRISPFDANKRRHTSFTSVEVVPEFTPVNTNDIVIRDEDLDVATFRSGGPGGQYVNKTESAIRIIHKPTGITVKCQEERSQIQNRAKCMEKLKNLLLIRREEEQLEEVSQLKGRLKKIEWGSQIRSYVFCPYTLVKDHRTGCETSDIQKVINGDIQQFINNYLVSIS